ncbi:MAG: glycosyltransferase [Nanoarchaeota archaeon]|nr:glycosyltransferase [Nanoarchaeota archaeon]
MLSIIIPTFNEEKYLPKLLGSLKSQTFSDFEIIVADNHSTDTTKAIAKAAGCTLVEGGLPAQGRATGAKIANGEMFFFVDADCVLQNDYLEKSLAEIKRGELDCAGSSISALDGNLLDDFYFAFFNGWMKLMQYLSAHAAGCSVFCTKEHYDKIGGFNRTIQLFEEHDFVRRAAKKGKFRILSSVKVATSVRRFVAQGRLKVALKLIISAWYRLFFGEIKDDLFEYHYDYRK